MQWTEPAGKLPVVRESCRAGSAADRQYVTQQQPLDYAMDKNGLLRLHVKLVYCLSSVLHCAWWRSSPVLSSSSYTLAAGETYEELLHNQTLHWTGAATAPVIRTLVVGPGQ